MQKTGIPFVCHPGYRLWTSVVVATLTFTLSKSWLPFLGSRFVFAWNIGGAMLLTLVAIMMWRTTATETLARARKEEMTNIVMLLGTILAVAAALVAIGYGLPRSMAMSRNLRIFNISQSVVGVFLAWGLLHVMYALHYAKLYYNGVDGDASAFAKGLVFPGNKDLVDYWDFVYYSLTIAMCFQTSDVTVTSPLMRRQTIFHATVAYLFALAILGLLLDGFIASI